MKNVFAFAVAAFCIAALAVSCQITTDIEVPQENSNLVTLKCEFPSLFGADTKATLDGDKKTRWEVGDQIVFQGCPKDGGASVAPVVHTLIASEIVNPRVAEITVDLSSLVPDESTPKKFNVAYPADKWSAYSSSHTYGRSRFTGATNQLLMAGYIEDDMSSITLNHVTAVILFKVPADLAGLVDSYTFLGNNSEVLGYDKYLVEINSNSPSYLAKLGAETYGTLDPVYSLSGPVTADGSTVHAVYIQNAANFTGGFTIQFKKSGDIKYTISTSTPLDLVHGHGVDLGALPMAKIHAYVAPVSHDSSIDLAGATDLSASGSANCYMIDGNNAANEGKVFKFKAYKGNSTTSVGNVASVEVLWETYNDNTTVTTNSVIAAVDYDKQPANDYYEIVFQMPASIHAGNALIAAKNSGGVIIWSWHIWVPNGLPTNVTDAQFAATNVMSRNLGALVDAVYASDTPTTSFGLLYQWGRKDPFPGFGSNVGSTPATVAGTAMTKTATKMSLEESIQNPTCFVYPGNDDWFSGENDGTFWYTGSKKVYDPCPVGYRVADRAGTGVIFWDGTQLVGNAALTQYDDNHSFTFNSLVFPLNGYIAQSNGNHSSAGTRSLIWSSRWDSGTKNAYCFYAYNDDGVSYKRTSVYRSRGGAIRCVAE